MKSGIFDQNCETLMGAGVAEGPINECYSLFSQGVLNEFGFKRNFLSRIFPDIKRGA
jgi:hypothetical protein